MAKFQGERASLANGLPRDQCVIRTKGCLRCQDYYTAVHVPTSQRQPFKITVEISDPLLREVRRLAIREGVTLRALVERGLHHVIAQPKNRATFKLRRASIKGKGLRAELREAGWDRLRGIIYEGRGG
jgi:hypothetical protein